MYKIHICIKNRRPLVTFRYHFCPREKSLDIEENSVQDAAKRKTASETTEDRFFRRELVTFRLTRGKSEAREPD